MEDFPVGTNASFAIADSSQALPIAFQEIVQP
jgi:hypothetical protein